MLALLLAAAIDLSERIRQSTDVKWLASVASKESAGKSDRSQAYARLGELGTAPSLAAVERIEKAARQWRPSDPLAPGMFTTPGFHFADSDLDTRISAEQNGVRYAVFVDYVFGDM